MVMFGKSLKEKQEEEWRQYYISYKHLKKKVNEYTQQVAVGAENHQYVLRDFSRLLDTQIEKVVLFILEQQGLLAERLARLGHRRDVLAEQAGGSMVVIELQDAYRAIGREMLRLLFFVEMNAIGLRKILKKFDKRLGYRFTDYYVKTRANHPYSQLQQVFKHVGFTAVVGAISHSLAGLHDNQSNYVSIYDQPALAHLDPVVGSIQAAVKRLSHSTNFLEYLAKHAFIFQEEPTEPCEENQLIEKRYDFMSLNLNLMNTFLYMVNTYIVVPTADKYSLSLGAAATVSGVVIGSMALAQVFSSVYFSAWSNRSYLRPLVFSSIVLLLGNVLYALAYDLDSITVLLIGRLFCGLGSARAVNRRYISDCVPLKLRMRASAGFVSASALGMACGPALACLFQTRFNFYSVTLNEETLPGWFMALAWLLYLLCLWVCFREPPPHQTKDHLMPESIAGTSTDILGGNVVLTQQLLMDSESERWVENADQEVEEADEGFKKNHMPVTSIVAAYRLLTPSVKVQLLVYFMLKYAMEILLAESSLVTGHYFIWSTRNVAIFLACLGLTVLPVNVVVGTYFSNIFEERQLLLAAEILLCIGIALSFHVINPYSVSQYVGAAVITFVSAEVLEGVNLSLLSRVMSSRLSRGTYNGGLLSTEAGTLARVVADGTITLSGYLGDRMLMNVTLVPSLLICISSIVATCFTYNSLY